MTNAFTQGYFKYSQDGWQDSLAKFYKENRNAVNTAGGGVLGGLLYLLTGGRGVLGGTASAGAGAGLGYLLGQEEPINVDTRDSKNKDKEDTSGNNKDPWYIERYYKEPFSVWKGVELAGGAYAGKEILRRSIGAVPKAPKAVIKVANKVYQVSKGKQALGVLRRLLRKPLKVSINSPKGTIIYPTKPSLNSFIKSKMRGTASPLTLLELACVAGKCTWEAKRLESDWDEIDIANRGLQVRAERLGRQTATNMKRMIEQGFSREDILEKYQKAMPMAVFPTGFIEEFNKMTTK